VLERELVRVLEWEPVRVPEPVSEWEPVPEWEMVWVPEWEMVRAPERHRPQVDSQRLTVPTELVVFSFSSWFSSPNIFGT
jgi:hypothetical protein